MGRIESRECGFDCLLGKRFKIVQFSTDLMKNEIFESFAVLFYIICLLVLAKKLICVLIQAACGTSQTMQEAVSIERELQLLNLKVPRHWWRISPLWRSIINPDSGLV